MVDFMLHQLPHLDPNSVLLPLEDCDSMNQTNHSDWKLLYFNSTSVHCLEHAPALTDAAYTRSLVLGGMAVLSLVGNLLTIYSIHSSRSVTVLVGVDLTDSLLYQVVRD